MRFCIILRIFLFFNVIEIENHTQKNVSLLICDFFEGFEITIDELETNSQVANVLCHTCHNMLYESNRCKIFDNFCPLCTQRLEFV